MNTIYLINKNNNRLKKNQQFFHHIFLIKNSKHLNLFSFQKFVCVCVCPTWQSACVYSRRCWPSVRQWATESLSGCQWRRQSSIGCQQTGGKM